MGLKKTYKRRKKRIDLQRRLIGVFLDCAQLGDKKIGVLNLTELGLGLDRRDITTFFRLGTEFQGVLAVGYLTVDICIRIVQFSSFLLGCEFVELSAEASKVIQIYFEPEMVGASMKLKIQNEKYILLQDFCLNKIELFFIGSHVVEFVLTFFGAVIQCSIGSHLVLMKNEPAVPLSDFMKDRVIRLINGTDLIRLSDKKMMLSILRRSPTVL